MRAPAPPRAILVVEDEPALAQLLTDILNEEPGYRAVAVADGATALDRIKAGRPHLILLDVDLPHLSGLQVYDLLQADPAIAGIPVLWVTANSDDRDFRARRFKQVLAKPFDLTALLTRVAALVPPPGPPALRDGAG